MAESDLFFTGSIEQAISTSVQSKKPLVVFVTDEQDTSSSWETQYLNDREISPALKDDVVTIRLLAGSVEAGYLSAFCPVTTFPTVLVIKNGVPVENIFGDVSKTDFTNRLKAAIGDKEAPTAPPQSEADLWDPPADARVPELPGRTASEQIQSDNVASTSQPDQQETQSPVPSTESTAASRNAVRIASMAEQTRQRVAALKAHREAEEIKAVKDRELSRRTVTQAKASAADAVKQRGNLTYIEEQRKRKEQANSERIRVLAQIENDKLVRKEREERRKMVERLMAESVGAMTETSVPVVGGVGVESDECALSFRLLDGSSIRARFPSSHTIRGEVRKWIDEYRTDGKEPYTLTQVLPPSPAKPITSETATLRELNLTPNASLILVSAGRRLPEGPNWFVAFFLMIWGLIKTLFGVGMSNPGHRQGEAVPMENTASGSTTVRDESMLVDEQEEKKKDKGKRRVYTLHDDEYDDERKKFYNGNQLDFEPRKDEDD